MTMKGLVQGKKEKDLYIMSIDSMPGILKIGRAANLSKRKKALEHSQPFYYKVDAIFPDCGVIETIIHNMLEPLNKKDCPGKEWFSISLVEAVTVITEAKITYADLIRNSWADVIFIIFF